MQQEIMKKNVTNGAPEEGAPLLSEKNLLMAHQWMVRHCYQCFYGAPLDGVP